MRDKIAEAMHKKKNKNLCLYVSIDWERHHSAKHMFQYLPLSWKSVSVL